MSEDLKPCPFCGSTPWIEFRGKTANMYCHNENCPMMDVNTGDLPIGEEAKHWNTRPIEDALYARIDELIPQADAAYAPYREGVQKARDETNKFSARVQELEEELAKEWIPCSERYPEELQVVLIHGISENELNNGFDVAWRYCGDWTSWNLRNVTHWMPLPEPPETA